MKRLKKLTLFLLAVFLYTASYAQYDLLVTRQTKTTPFGRFMPINALTTFEDTNVIFRLSHSAQATDNIKKCIDSNWVKQVIGKVNLQDVTTNGLSTTNGITINKASSGKKTGLDITGGIDKFTPLMVQNTNGDTFAIFKRTNNEYTFHKLGAIEVPYLTEDKITSTTLTPKSYIVNNYVSKEKYSFTDIVANGSTEAYGANIGINKLILISPLPENGGRTDYKYDTLFSFDNNLFLKNEDTLFKIGNNEISIFSGKIKRDENGDIPFYNTLKFNPFIAPDGKALNYVFPENKATDTIVCLWSEAFINKLNASDTIYMSNLISTKITYNEAMYLIGQNKIDTTFLSNSIKSKLNKSDTILYRKLANHETWDSITAKPNLGLQYITTIGDTTNKLVYFKNTVDFSGSPSAVFGVTKNRYTTANFYANGDTSTCIYAQNIGKVGAVADFRTDTYKTIGLKLNSFKCDTFALFQDANFLSKTIFRKSGAILTPTLTLSEINTFGGKCLATKEYIDSAVVNKQDKLTSGTTIKSINGLSILSSGNINTINYFSEAYNTGSPNTVVPVSTLYALGDETNIDVSIVPKGTGSFQLTSPDGGAGGNKRGENSVDLQIYRGLNADMVASGNYSFLAGLYSKASGLYSIALGKHAFSDKQGQFSIGTVQGFTSGRCQSSILNYSKATSNATTTDVTDGLLTIPSNKAIAFTITFCITKTSSPYNQTASIIRRGLVYNNGGNAYIEGAIQTIGTDIINSNLSGITVNISATNNKLKIDVNGLAAINLQWTTHVELTEVGSN